MSRYTINGVSYDRLEDVPPHLRPLVDDRDGNGIPDAFERLFPPNFAPEVKMAHVVSRKFLVNSVEYERLEDLPPDVRALLEDKNADGLPDALEGLMNATRHAIGAQDASRPAAGFAPGAFSGARSQPADRSVRVDYRLEGSGLAAVGLLLAATLLIGLVVGAVDVWLLM
jgi:hypothetical protein